MTREELIQKLDDIEWEDFEVKKAKTDVPKNVRETVSAFSNTSGGWIIFGVSQSGKKFNISDVNNPDKLEQDFTTSLRGEIYNIKITPECKKHKFDEGVVLAFKIPPSNKKPVYFNNPKNTFIRTASGDQRATQEEIDAMYRDAAFGTKDSELTEFTISDLNDESVDGFRNYLATINQSHTYNRYSTEKMLEKLRVLKSGKVTIGGLLFFGTQDIIEDYLTDFRIDYLEIPGRSVAEAKTRYSYRLSSQANLFEYYFSIYPRLSKQIDIPFETDIHGMSVEEQPQVIAIREALVNLLMHTDYFSPLKPRIRVFTDHIEFFNPGALPKDIEIILKEDLTLPRNPVIAKIFRVINLAQNAGYGFEKMINGWDSYYHSEPEITPGQDFYKISFAFDTDKVPDKTGGTTGGTTGGKTGGKTGGQTGGQIGGQIGGQRTSVLTDRQKEVLDIITNRPTISRKALAKKLGGINESAVQKHIEALKKKRAIERIGSDAIGYWKVFFNQ